MTDLFLPILEYIFGVVTGIGIGMWLTGKLIQREEKHKKRKQKK